MPQEALGIQAGPSRPQDRRVLEPAPSACPANTRPGSRTSVQRVPGGGNKGRRCPEATHTQGPTLRALGGGGSRASHPRPTWGAEDAGTGHGVALASPAWLPWAPGHDRGSDSAPLRPLLSPAGPATDREVSGGHKDPEPAHQACLGCRSGLPAGRREAPTPCSSPAGPAC